ncbi:MAG: hypothetical protein LBK69_03495 [Syntrophomonadaceae bacterium]|jgi:hypothetical protein|nr:hypothetical protein [Syntrophomonadaceae bacterium]
MKIKRETFIEDFVQTAIMHVEAFNVTTFGYSFAEIDTAHKLANKLSVRLRKLADFLAQDPVFAKDTLDRLVLNTNPHVMFATAGVLWEFNYRMEDCYRLFEKVLEKGKKETMALIAANNFYLAIKEGRLKRRKEFPKLG